MRIADEGVLRERLQSWLEEIHARLGTELRDFDGDTTTLADARPLLEDCLLSKHEL